MSELSTRVVSWLAEALSTHSFNIQRAAIYGSLIKGKRNPSDCDLLIVFCGSPDSIGWLRLRQYLLRIKNEFFGVFSLPLSVCLLTSDEEKQFSWLFFDARELNLTNNFN